MEILGKCQTVNEPCLLAYTTMNVAEFVEVKILGTLEVREGTHLPGGVLLSKLWVFLSLSSEYSSSSSILPLSTLRSKCAHFWSTRTACGTSRGQKDHSH